ncbi:thiamine biosynthesis protein ThiS, partial [Salmonella enterica subsp. enterica serovar Typhimurium]|uniref:sulfur carrier protein ThiS n=1 Tax=Salmonella enterica TaxID=28901 RepID=UPI00115B4AF6
MFYRLFDNFFSFFEEWQTVSELLTQLNQLKPGAALALNQQILPREQWQQQIVQEGDQ